jgi:hypothetical protein
MELTHKEYSNCYVGTTFGMKIDQPGGQKLMSDALEAVHPQVVILDPLYKMLAGDENEVTDVRAALDFLDNCIAIYKCSILLIHHAGKDHTRRARGSSVIEDWVDSMIQLKRVSKDEDDLEVEFIPQLMRHGALLPPIKAKLTNFEFVVPVAGTSSIEGKILELIKTSKELSPAKILGAGIGSNTSVYGALETLCALGLIHKVKRGIYAAGAK